MNAAFFKSDRHFVVFDAMVSHGHFLLRSQKSNFPVNVDIVFFDTSYIQLVWSFLGISIRIVDNNDIIAYASVNKYLSYPDSHLFELESNGEKYYIAASFCKVFENELEFNETSVGMIPDKERGKLIASTPD